MRGFKTVIAAAGIAAVVVSLAACQRSNEPASTPLPTRQTTIDPVTKKLDTAAKDIEARRQAVDDAAK